MRTNLAPKYKTNQIYADLSPCLKVALSVFEQGLRSKDDKAYFSTHRSASWLSKLSRDLEGQVSRATIDQCLDHLLDEGMLSHGKEIMQRVKDDGGNRWVRAYHIGNEFVDHMINLYKASHEIKSEQIIVE